LTESSSIVVESLRNRFESDREFGVACIFCNYKEQVDQTSVNLLAALWLQLVHGKKTPSDDVVALYKKLVNRETRPTLNDIAEVLNKEIARYQKAYVVVDALDECAESSRVEILEKLRAKNPTLRLLVTSRLYDSIARQFEGQPRLEIAASAHDVRAYVRGRITQGSRLERYVIKDPSLREDIENTVSAKAQKM
jgi:hypothetical protein